MKKFLDGNKFTLLTFSFTFAVEALDFQDLLLLLEETGI